MYQQFLSRRPLHNVCAVVHSWVLATTRRGELIFEWADKLLFSFEAQLPQTWRIHSVMSPFHDPTFFSECFLTDFQSQCYYRSLCRLRRIFSYIKGKRAEINVWELILTRLELISVIVVYVIYRDRFETKSEFRWNWCVSFEMRRSAFLNNSKSCCVELQFLRAQLLALIGHVMFDLVTWSFLGPVFGCWSSHIIILNRW